MYPAYDDPHAQVLELRGRIADLEHELQSREAQLQQLRGISTGVLPDDTRQAIKFEILQEIKKRNTKTFALLSAVCTILATFASVVGYEAIKRSVYDHLPINTLTGQLQTAAEAELRTIGQASERVKALENRIRVLQRTADQSQRDLSRLTQSMETVQSDTASIIDALPPEARSRFENLSGVRRMRYFGVTPAILATVIRRERPLFEISAADEGQLHDVITWLQTQYDLRPDGVIGPATALVVLALAIEQDRAAVNAAVKDSGWVGRDRWYELSMAPPDRQALRRLMTDPRNHIGPALRQVVEILGPADVLLH